MALQMLDDATRSKPQKHREVPRSKKLLASRFMAYSKLKYLSNGARIGSEHDSIFEVT